MPSARTQNPNATDRHKLAFTINTVRGPHILDRLVDGYGWDGIYHYPQMDMVSLYVDQAIYPTMIESLRFDAGKLAVDGVTLVAENGDHPNIAFTPELNYWRI